jgi:hypothetical protein
MTSMSKDYFVRRVSNPEGIIVCKCKDEWDAARTYVSHYWGKFGSPKELAVIVEVPEQAGKGSKHITVLAKRPEFAGRTIFTTPEEPTEPKNVNLNTGAIAFHVTLEAGESYKSVPAVIHEPTYLDAARFFVLQRWVEYGKPKTVMVRVYPVLTNLTVDHSRNQLVQVVCAAGELPTFIASDYPGESVLPSIDVVEGLFTAKHTCSAGEGSLRCRACNEGLPPDPDPPMMTKLKERLKHVEASNVLKLGETAKEREPYDYESDPLGINKACIACGERTRTTIPFCKAHWPYRDNEELCKIIHERDQLKEKIAKLLSILST